MFPAHPTHFVCGLIWRLNEQHDVEFLVIDVRSVHPVTGHFGPVQTKFPGGMNREKLTPPESISTTLQREILEETGLALLPQHAEEI